MTKAAAIILLGLATVLVLSSAIPVTKENGHDKSLVRNDPREASDKQSLSNKKPPAKVPGPKLNNPEFNLPSLSEDEKAIRNDMKLLSKQQRQEKMDSLTTDIDVESKETQEERSFS